MVTIIAVLLVNALTDWYQGYHSYTSMVLPLLLVLYGLVELYMYKYYRIYRQGVNHERSLTLKVLVCRPWKQKSALTIKP